MNWIKPILRIVTFLSVWHGQTMSLPNADGVYCGERAWEKTPIYKFVKYLGLLKQQQRNTKDMFQHHAKLLLSVFKCDTNAQNITAEQEEFKLRALHYKF